MPSIIGRVATIKGFSEAANNAHSGSSGIRTLAVLWNLP